MDNRRNGEDNSKIAGYYYDAEVGRNWDGENFAKLGISGILRGLVCYCFGEIFVNCRPVEGIAMALI